ncbi:MAG: Gfo/Idh/MocA family oxidoreductase [Terracoccus sp.]
MKTPIRIAVVGAGMAEQAHAFGYRNASMAADLVELDVQLVVVVDPNLSLAQRVADRYGFAAATADLDAVLADPDVDVVSVAVPNFRHRSVLTAALASGKHVLAEKPVGRTAEESKALADLAGTCSAVTGVGFSFRRLPGLAAIAAAVADGRLGEVHTVRGWYDADYASDPLGAWSWRYSQTQSGGGALLDIGSHVIDAVQFVAGPIVSVEAALLRTLIDERPPPATTSTGPAPSSRAQSTPTSPMSRPCPEAGSEPATPRRSSPRSRPCCAAFATTGAWTPTSPPPCA